MEDTQLKDSVQFVLLNGRHNIKKTYCCNKYVLLIFVNKTSNAHVLTILQCNISN